MEECVHCTALSLLRRSSPWVGLLIAECWGSGLRFVPMLFVSSADKWSPFSGVKTSLYSSFDHGFCVPQQCEQSDSFSQGTLIRLLSVSTSA